MVAALAFALSACSSAADAPPPGTATASAPASTSAPARKKIAYTKPGTKLKIGEKAVVPFTTDYSPVGAVGITVTRIDRGTEAELARMNLGDDHRRLHGQGRGLRHLHDGTGHPRHHGYRREVRRRRLRLAGQGHGLPGKPDRLAAVIRRQRPRPDG
ncbi:hypothetical protein GCM10009565_05860 [Amycolatopsis albidoflavus]